MSNDYGQDLNHKACVKIMERLKSGVLLEPSEQLHVVEQLVNKSFNNTLVKHINLCVYYITEKEWEWVEEELNDDLKPGDTVLWSALMVNHLLSGHPHPKDRFMQEIDGLKVDDEGNITNPKEYFKDEY